MSKSLTRFAVGRRMANFQDRPSSRMPSQPARSAPMQTDELRTAQQLRRHEPEPSPVLMLSWEEASIMALVGCARQRYDNAVNWIEKFKNRDHPQHRFRAEVNVTLELKSRNPEFSEQGEKLWRFF
jgi:hypothetical protein